ncbi:MAG: MBL fold metallo-hydrolase [bacterium]
MKICVLGSGSSGNATLVASARARVLVDAGFSCREIVRRLSSIGISPEDLHGVVVSHEHTDHLRGLETLSKRLDIPIYLSRGTWDAIRHDKGSRFRNVRTFSPGKQFDIEDITFESFSVLHDAADPVGFCIHSGGAKLGVATDLGKTTHLVRESLRGSHCLILESNHDPGMLVRGPYPWWLKQRIKGMFGHLSNEDSSSLLSDLLHSDLSHVVLAHLSQVNNQEEMAHLNALRVLREKDCHHIQVRVAGQDCVTDPILVGEDAQQSGCC